MALLKAHRKSINAGRFHPVLTAVLAGLLLLVVLFDWNWFRVPVEKYVSRKTERDFHIASLGVRLGLAPTIVMDKVYFANAKWGRAEPMASVGKVEFSVSLRDLFEGKVLLPRVALTDADLLFERAADDRKNWVLAEPSSRSPSRVRVSTLSINNGRMRYIDHGIPFDLTVKAGTFDPAAEEDVKKTNSPTHNDRYSTRYAFNGDYRGATFSGTALTGGLLSFQESGELFPFQGKLVAGTTRLEAEGSIADAANISAIDVDLKIAGATLANLYPFLLLPLPASPPYELRGHLALKGNRYALEHLAGKIGSTDVSGKGSYVQRSPRPLLKVDLHSNLLNMADLGPLIGIKTRESKDKPGPSQAQTSTKSAASETDQALNKNHILPAGDFEGKRLQAIDAEMSLESKQLKAPGALPFESIQVSLQLKDAVLKLAPLQFGFAGGTITSNATLDAREPLLKSTLQADFKRLQLAKLFPQSPDIAKAAGSMGAKIDISGTGNSIADIAAKSNGRISAVTANGRVSNLLDAISGLNGGKVMRLLISGDQDIAVRCGVVAFDIANGQGTSRLFLIDTAQTQIVGNGGFDLEHENFALTVEPKPKKPGIFSLRTPVRLYGSFRHPEFELQKGPLAARAGASLALAAINPLAALIPLIETGPGTETDCSQLFAAANPSR